MNDRTHPHPAQLHLQAETTRPTALPDTPTVPGRHPGHGRLMRSELRLVFRRRRNLLLLAAVGAAPLVIGIGLRLTTAPGQASGANVAFIQQLAGNGIFLSLVTLTLLLTSILPLVIAVVAGDAIASDASHGTLRYLLTVPTGRTRLLAAKYAASATYASTATLLVTGVALATGAALFPIGPVTLLSGTTVSFADGILRLTIVTIYITAGMVALTAMGIALSTLTEHGIAAIATLTILVITSEILDTVPQFAPIHPYLPTHWWDSYDALLRTPVDTTTVLHGLLSFAIYLAVAATIAWAKFTTADITS